MEFFDFKNFCINELRKVEGKMTESTTHIFWNEGNIYVDPKDVQSVILSSGFGKLLGFRVVMKEKLLKISPMDDWADTKIVRQLQQALQDFIRAKLITSEWNCIVTSKTLTERTFGSSKVQDIVNFNAHYTKEVPISFHGTLDIYVEKIKEEGIIPRNLSKSPPNWANGYAKDSKKLSYFSTDYDRALYYAKHAAEYHTSKKGGRAYPAVVEIKNLPIEYLTIDDDFRNNVSKVQFLAVLRSGKKPSTKSELISSIRTIGQFAVNKIVPPELISKSTLERNLTKKINNTCQ
jgi:hypothetical protein